MRPQASNRTKRLIGTKRWPVLPQLGYRPAQRFLIAHSLMKYRRMDKSKSCSKGRAWPPGTGICPFYPPDTPVASFRAQENLINSRSRKRPNNPGIAVPRIEAGYLVSLVKLCKQQAKSRMQCGSVMRSPAQEKATQRSASSLMMNL